MQWHVIGHWKKKNSLLLSGLAVNHGEGLPLAATWVSGFRHVGSNSHHFAHWLDPQWIVCVLAFRLVECSKKLIRYWLQGWQRPLLTAATPPCHALLRCIILIGCRRSHLIGQIHMLLFPSCMEKNLWKRSPPTASRSSFMPVWQNQCLFKTLDMHLETSMSSITLTTSI